MSRCDALSLDLGMIALAIRGAIWQGHKDTVEALTWDAKAYFFSTPPMTLQAQMTDKALEMLQKKRDQAYGDEERLVDY